MFLIVAVAIGAVATMVAFFFLSAQAQKQTEAQKIKIWVAKRPIPSGKLLDLGNDIQQLPFGATPEMKQLAALCFTDAPPPNRQRVNRPIAAGGFLFKTDLGGTADIVFEGPTSTTRPRSNEPTMALSIPVQGANALSGLLVPGDYVKVLITKPDEGSTAASPSSTRPPVGYVTTPLFDNEVVHVLAVGSRISRNRGELLASGVYDASRDMENIKTITVEVTQKQAEAYLRATGGNLWPVTVVLPNVKKPD
jgi:Flp pilus assembly protein CpaB